MRAIEADLLAGSELYREVMLEKVAHARESVWISTANVKDMQIERDGWRGATGRGRSGAERGGKFASVNALFSELASRGVELRLLHAELPSRPFRRSFDKRQLLVRGGLALKICPRVHFKAVVVDGAWVYLGSANLTGAGLGAKSEGRRNFELGFCTEDFETVDRVKAFFEAIWNGDECAACKLRSVCPDPIGKPAPRSLVRLGHSRRFGRR